MDLLARPSIFQSCLEKTYTNLLLEDSRTSILLKLKELLKEKPEEMTSGIAVNPVEIKSLPSKHQGRPLLLGKKLGQTIQEYITNLRAVGGVVNIPLLLVLPGGLFVHGIVMCF